MINKVRFKLWIDPYQNIGSGIKSTYQGPENRIYELIEEFVISLVGTQTRSGIGLGDIGKGLLVLEYRLICFLRCLLDSLCC